MVSQQHIPAWKKLGLKLKYAKDISVDTNENVDNVSSQKRKFPIEEEDSIRIASIPSKKIKAPKKSHAVSKSPTANGSILPSSAQEDHPIQRILTPSPSPAKRKSVSFTPETKVEDGDSIKQLYAAWLAGQKQEDPSFRAEAASKALKSITPASASDAKDLSKVKKAKKPKPRSLSSSFPTSQAPTSTYTPPLLIYLSDYHTSPTSWKFNKAKQTHLLKSVFDTTLIPSSYDTALKAYLTGLNGSAARSRLRAAALEIRKQDAKEEQEEEKEEASPKTEDNTTPSTTDQKKGDEMENPALRRQNYKQALRWYKAQLEDEEFEREERERELDPAWQLKLAKRKRAELILCAIGETEPDALDGGAVPGTERATGAENGDVAGGQKKMRLGDGTVVLVVKKKRKRKRKVRTGVPDDDSSSSSESSSSSSSSSSSDSDSSVEADESEASTSDESDDDGDDTSSSSSSSSASASQETESTGSSKESGDASGSPSSGGSGNESESSSGESSRSDNEEGVEEEEE